MGGSKSQGESPIMKAARLQKELKAQQDATAEQQRMFNEQKALRQTEMERGKGYIGQEANKFERAAGVTVPGFEGFRDRETGELLDGFSFDPYKSDTTRSLRDEAMSNDPSRWAQNKNAQQAYEQSQGLAKTAMQQQQAQSSAQSQLMRQGGLGGGARTSLARSGARDALLASQGVRQDGANRRFGIMDQDLTRKQDIMGTLADVERQSELQNIGMREKDVTRRTNFDQGRYSEQMKAWAAEKQAAAQRAAGGGGGCFPEWTMIKLRNGTWAPISEIKVGDELFIGGKVIALHNYEDNVHGYAIYDYCGVDVTGSHSVLEYATWVHVEDSKKAIKTTRTVKTVYNLSTETHQLLIKNVLFADHMETDEDIADAQESLNALNGATA